MAIDVLSRSISELCREDHQDDPAQIRIVWRGEAVTELDVKMRVTAIAKLARGGEMRERLLALAKEGRPDSEIARLSTRT